MKPFLPFASIALTLLLAIANFLQCSAETRGHYFVNDKEAGGALDTGNFLRQSEYHDCFIIVKETKRIGGQCMKIRDEVQGCVAKGFVHPLHHDCL